MSYLMRFIFSEPNSKLHFFFFLITKINTWTFEKSELLIFVRLFYPEIQNDHMKTYYRTFSVMYQDLIIISY